MKPAISKRQKHTSVLFSKRYVLQGVGVIVGGQHDLQVSFIRDVLPGVPDDFKVPRCYFVAESVPDDEPTAARFVIVMEHVVAERGNALTGLPLRYFRLYFVRTSFVLSFVLSLYFV